MGEHMPRWYRIQWNRSRAIVQTSMDNKMPAFTIQLNPFGQCNYTGPAEIREFLQPQFDSIVAAMQAWQKGQERDGADTRAVTCVILEKPSKPVAQLGNKEIRKILPAWIRALNPGSALPQYNKPAMRPAYWPEDIPWASPYRKPAGFNGDWTVALRRVMASCIRHIGQDPSTYHRMGVNQHPAPRARNTQGQAARTQNPPPGEQNPPPGEQNPPPSEPNHAAAPGDQTSRDRTEPLSAPDRIHVGEDRAGPVPSQRTRPVPAPRTPRHRPAEAGPTPDGNLASRTNQDQRWDPSTATPVTSGLTRAVSSSSHLTPDFSMLSDRSSFGVTSPPESTSTPIPSPASSPISPVEIRQKRPRPLPPSREPSKRERKAKKIYTPAGR